MRLLLENRKGSNSFWGPFSATSDGGSHGSNSFTILSEWPSVSVREGEEEIGRGSGPCSARGAKCETVVLCAGSIKPPFVVFDVKRPLRRPRVVCDVLELD